MSSLTNSGWSLIRLCFSSMSAFKFTIQRGRSLFPISTELKVTIWDIEISHFLGDASAISHKDLQTILKRVASGHHLNVW